MLLLQNTSDGYNYYYTLPNVHAAVAYHNCTQQVSETRETDLTGSNFSSPWSRTESAMPFRVRGGEKGFAHGATGEKSAGKVFYPTPVCRCACRSQRESSPPPRPLCHTLSRRSYPLRIRPRASPSRRYLARSLGHCCTYITVGFLRSPTSRVLRRSPYNVYTHVDIMYICIYI